MGSKQVSLKRVKELADQWDKTHQGRDVKAELSDLVDEFGADAVIAATNISLRSLSTYLSNGNMSINRLNRAISILNKL